MCGIAGIIHFNQAPLTDQRLIDMGNAIRYRGPDDSGIWNNGTTGFAHQRLSVIDPSMGGHQPMLSPDGQYAIVFNGEIYNHNEFRNELRSIGFVFRSTSDTEVLLYLYMAYGSEMLNRVNGMFAFAIWDNRKNELFVCRDRLGVKPFYYSIQQTGFYFASEAIALFAGGIQKVVDNDNLNEWLLYRFVAGAETLYKNVKKLLPGHYAIIKPDGAVHTHRWYKLGDRIQNHSHITNPEQWFEETFHSSVRYRMESDVPVGVLLSGGLDSSSIAASLYHSHFRNIQTFNIGFRNLQHNESQIAREFSKSLQFPFHTIFLEGDELFENLIKSVRHLDEPLTHMNDPHILAISGYANKHVKVLLSGEGADEFMAGYVRYKPFRYLPLLSALKLVLSVVPRNASNGRLLKLKRYFQSGNIDQLIMSNASNYFESDFKSLGLTGMNISNPYRQQILQEAKEIFPSDPTRQVLYYDQHTHLQSLNERNDKTTMASSIECRDPFQDYRLVEGLGTLDLKWLTTGKKGKYILKKTMSPYLPPSILKHKKIGLSVPWMSHIKENPQLSGLWNDFAQNPSMGVEELDRIQIKPIIDDLQKGKTTPYQSLALQYFMYYIWSKTS